MTPHMWTNGVPGVLAGTQREKWKGNPSVDITDTVHFLEYFMWITLISTRYDKIYIIVVICTPWSKGKITV